MSQGMCDGRQKANRQEIEELIIYLEEGIKLSIEKMTKAALLAEVRRLQELLDYEKVNHAEAMEEVKRLNLINENGWGPDALRKHLKEAAGNG